MGFPLPCVEPAYKSPKKYEKRRLAKPAESKSATDTKQSLRARLRVTLFVALAVVIGVHVFVRQPTMRPLHVGLVQERFPEKPESYAGSAIATKPDLILVGDSQQLFSCGKVRNRTMVLRSGGDMILDGLSRRLSALPQAHPPWTFVRFATFEYKPIEMLASLGIWLRRAQAMPKIVVLSIAPFPLLRPTPEPDALRPEIAALLSRYPEDSRALFAEIDAVQNGREVAALLRQTRPPTKRGMAAEAERALIKWLDEKGYFEGSESLQEDLILRFQRLEAPLLQTIFGRIDQRGDPGASDVDLVHEPSVHRVNGAPLELLIRFLKARSITPVCFIGPWNPRAIPRSKDASNLVVDIIQRASAAGCQVIDGSDSPQDSNWGYWGGKPDLSHLCAPGIEQAAERLFQEGNRLEVWQPLFQMAASKSPQ